MRYLFLIESRHIHQQRFPTCRWCACECPACSCAMRMNRSYALSYADRSMWAVAVMSMLLVGKSRSGGWDGSGEVGSSSII